MKKSTIIALHIMYWAFYMIFNVVVFGLTAILGKSDSVSKAISYGILPSLLLGLASFYIFYLYLVPVYLAKRKIWQFFALGFAAILMLSMLAIFIQMPSDVLTYAEVNDNAPYLLVAVQWSFIIAIYFFFGMINAAIATLAKGFVVWYDDIHLKEIIKAKNVQTELSLLKAQLSPHFLFNTLNNIGSLVESNPIVGVDYLNKLSEILRYMLYDTGQELVPVTQEIQYIQRFIELQKIRTSNEKFVSTEITITSPDVKIAPMLFIPYIENAFKYSTDKKVSDAISVAITANDKSIHFACRNIINRPIEKETGRNKIGLSTARQRLELQYGETYKLETSEQDGYFNVDLNVPAK